jgi:hypothetical protein
MNLPYMKKPCNNCPFRKDSKQGWLGLKRIKEILKQDTFVCHKTLEYDDEGNNLNNTTLKQCAGHMIHRKELNVFYRLLKIIKLENTIKGHNLIFSSTKELMKHHNYE